MDDIKRISRRKFLAGSAALASLGLFSSCQQGSGFANTSENTAEQTSNTASNPQNSGMRLIMLGTNGGPRLNKLRSSPAQVILVNGVPYVIDCGSGVGHQLVYAGVDLKDLRYVFITHHHSDHNLDYGNLLYQAWVHGRTTPVDAYGPPPLKDMTDLFLKLNDYGIQIRIPDEGRKPLAPLMRPHETSEGGSVMEDDNVKVTSTLVDHTPVKPAFAYRFDCADRSIVISVDTIFSKALIELAQGADVLVHEAYYEPGVRQLVANLPNRDALYEQIGRSHTTTEDAGRVAKEAGVKTLVVSHLIPGFGPSAPDDDVWRQEAEKQFGGEVIVGKDLVEV